MNGLKLLAMVISIALLISSLPGVVAELRCDSFVSNCKNPCDTTGECSSGTYSGLQRGCDNGDPSVSTSTYYPDAEAYLEQLGYCHSWIGSSYSSTDFTKRLGSGQCRYQAIRSTDNHYITHNDGPEPNPQPAYFCNGNPDLILPWGCVRNTIEGWHIAC